MSTSIHSFSLKRFFLISALARFLISQAVTQDVQLDQQLKTLMQVLRVAAGADTAVSHVFRIRRC